MLVSELDWLDRQVAYLFGRIRHELRSGGKIPGASCEHEPKPERVAAIKASLEHEKDCPRCQLASEAIRNLADQQAERDGFLERTRDDD